MKYETKKQRIKKYLDAVDIVCGECTYARDKNCKNCFIRKTVEGIQK